MPNEKEIEQEIQDKGLNAPRLNPQMIDEMIVGETYWYGGDARNQALVKTAQNNELVQRGLKCITVCVLVLDNGFCVTGESACASPENFDAELGKKIAREKARESVWRLAGFRLRDKLHASAT